MLHRVLVRVNPGNRSEAYCTVPGLPCDVLLRGEVSHNRAIEGDTVVVALNGLADWFVMHKETAKVGVVCVERWWRLIGGARGAEGHGCNGAGVTRASHVVTSRRVQSACSFSS